MHNRRALVFLLAVSLFPCMTKAQIDTDRIPPAQDSRELYRRAAASQLVVVGTVIGSAVISKRMTPELTQRVKSEGDLSLTLGGALYTIRTEYIVCRQADFKTDGPTPPEAPQTLYIFVPRDGPLFVDGHRRETLVLGQRYLLFLVAPPPHVRQNWVSSFQLDPKLDYYRGEELSRGVIPLAQGANDPNLLERVTLLCRALKEASLADKLAALKRLSTSSDPVLREEATAAEEALKAQQPQPARPK